MVAEMLQKQQFYFYCIFQIYVTRFIIYFSYVYMYFMCFFIFVIYTYFHTKNTYFHKIVSFYDTRKSFLYDFHRAFDWRNLIVNLYGRLCKDRIIFSDYCDKIHLTPFLYQICLAECTLSDICQLRYQMNLLQIII